MRISSLAPGEFSSYRVIRFFICLSRLPGVRLRVSHGNAQRVSVARTASFVGADPFREPFDTQRVHTYRENETRSFDFCRATRTGTSAFFPRFSFALSSLSRLEKGNREKRHRSFGRVPFAFARIDKRRSPIRSCFSTRVDFVPHPGEKRQHTLTTKLLRDRGLSRSI